MFDCLDVGRSVLDAAFVRSIIAYIEEPTTSDARGCTNLIRKRDNDSKKLERDESHVGKLGQDHM